MAMEIDDVISAARSKPEKAPTPPCSQRRLVAMLGISVSLSTFFLLRFLSAEVLDHPPPFGTQLLFALTAGFVVGAYMHYSLDFLPRAKHLLRIYLRPVALFFAAFATISTVSHLAGWPTTYSLMYSGDMPMGFVPIILAGTAAILVEVPLLFSELHRFLKK